MKCARFVGNRLFFLCIMIMLSHYTATACYGANLKLVETPLNQVIELYSRETGKNVFLDETVQKHRRVSAHLQNMGIEDAFEVVKKTIGLETYEINSNTILLFPTERAQKYRAEMKAAVLQLPEGLEGKWATGLIGSFLPGIKVSQSPNNQRAVLIIGPKKEVDQLPQVKAAFQTIASKQAIVMMPENAAKLAKSEWNWNDVELEAQTNGLIVRGTDRDVKTAVKRLQVGFLENRWGEEVFTPEYVDPGKIFKAAEATKGRITVTDLGGTGSILIEGTLKDRKRLLLILNEIDLQARKQRRVVSLGEIKPATVKEAIKTLGGSVESIGEKRVVLVGRSGAIDDAADVLKTLGKKRNQVRVRFRLAEIARTRLKTLGIDLDKSSYSYGEIKAFHPNDNLPLLLRVLEEGRDGRILAEPNIRVIEGEEAKVTIGDRIPLEVAATAQTDSGSTLKLNTQLEWVDVGIKMTVGKVSVNPDRSICMALKGEVSSVVATTKQGYPQIRTREAESFVRVENGGAIVMGGLLSWEERHNQNKIPIVGDIPLFGGLARSRDRQKIETEIIMLISAGVAEE